MKRYNLYIRESMFDGDYDYIGHMSFDSNGLSEMEILPPELFIILSQEVDDVKKHASENGYVLDSPNDIFRGRFWNITVFDSENDPNFKDIWL